MCSCCSIKCWFIFFNMLLLASGVALVTIGVTQYSAFIQMSTFAQGGLSKFAIVLIAMGITVILISFLGNFGAFFKNSSMLAAFICSLIVIVILEMLTGAALYILRSRASVLEMNSAINTKARAMFYDYSLENRRAINKIQEKFSCCGADSYTDWSRSLGWENHNAVPDSCCVAKSEGCGQDKMKIHRKGCILAIKHFLLRNLVWVSAVCIALGLTEFCGLLVGVCLCLDIKWKNYENLK